MIAGGERSDRYFVLFSSTLLMLSTSPRMSSFVYEVSKSLFFPTIFSRTLVAEFIFFQTKTLQGKLPLTGIRVVATKVDDTKNSFEISGN